MKRYLIRDDRNACFKDGRQFGRFTSKPEEARAYATLGRARSALKFDPDRKLDDFSIWEYELKPTSRIFNADGKEKTFPRCSQ